MDVLEGCLLGESKRAEVRFRKAVEEYSFHDCIEFDFQFRFYILCLIIKRLCMKSFIYSANNWNCHFL